MLCGVQLYSLNKQIEEEGLEKILEKIASSGYDGVEFAGFYNYSALQLKSMLKKYHLKALGIHASLDLLEDIDKFKDYIQILNIPTVTYPYLPVEYRQDLAFIKNRLSKIIFSLKDYNIIFNYHNHDFEFENNQNILLDLLKDVDDLYAQPDIFWLTVAGFDAVDFIKENLSKIKIIHIKELGEEKFGPSPVIGRGKAKCKEVLQLAKDSKIEFVILESENVGNDYETYLKDCYEVLKDYK